ncbi:hypothetical protein G9A89_019781 [Geosiphon pyriformis]|nr:hypothetical protein G9A89_019781 [Geosiphon pyriformis]
MAAKAKNSKKQQQTVATVMVIPNSFMVPDKILEKISIAAVSSLPDMNGNNNGTFHKIRKNQPQAVLPDVVLFGRSLSVIKTKQFITPDNLKDWTDQIKIKLTAPSPVSGTADNSAWENIAWSSGMASVSSPPLFVAFHDVLLGIFSDNIKAALGIFGVVTSIKLKPAGLW